MTIRFLDQEWSLPVALVALLGTLVIVALLVFLFAKEKGDRT